jgi:HK97 family phage major capsid protein
MHDLVNVKAAEFSAYARMIVQAKEVGQLEQLAERGTERIKSIVSNRLAIRDYLGKSAIDPANMTNSSALTSYADLSEAFLESVGAYGAFDRMVAAMRPLPIKSRIVITTLAGTGATIGEGQLKKATRLSLDGVEVALRKAVGIIVMSDEVTRLSGVRGARLFRGELTKAVAAATDAEFIAELVAGVTPIASFGSTAEALRIDIRIMLQQIDSDDSSKFYLLMSSSSCKNMALLEDDDLLRNLTVTGGSIAGIEVVVTDAAEGNLILCDANQLGADRGLIDVNRSKQATIQLNDAPDSPPTASTLPTSLWQANLSALKIERWFGVEKLRSAAVAVISGAQYGGANSPA